MVTETKLLEPHWCNMFEVAIWQTRAKIADPDDRVMILEMLQYGKRLVQANCKDGCIEPEIPDAEQSYFIGYEPYEPVE